LFPCGQVIIKLLRKLDRLQHEKENLERSLEEKEEDVPQSHEEKVANRPPPVLPHQIDPAKEVA
jgi:hypothetical protein